MAGTKDGRALGTPQRDADLELIRRALTPVHKDDPGFTIKELVRATHKSDQWVRDKLIELKAQGRLVRGTKMVEGLDEKPYPIPAYRILK